MQNQQDPLREAPGDKDPFLGKHNGDCEQCLKHFRREAPGIFRQFVEQTL